MTTLENSPVTTPQPPPVLSALGDPAAMMLGGPPAGSGAETLGAFDRRVGDHGAVSGTDVLSAVWASGLQGRGGGGFPLWRKLDAARQASAAPELIVNCSESEPASRKDRTLCASRPHTVLEGAAAIARAIGAPEVVLHVHGDAVDSLAAFGTALRERAGRHGDPRWRLSQGPGGYVSGEASAVARFVHGGPALPLASPLPLAHQGPSGRPTVVSNAETAAHVAHILSVGVDAWRAAGTETHPGPQLLTLVGAVPRPGRVVEVAGLATIGEVLASAGVPAPPAAVLIGGYAGTWLEGTVAWQTPMEPRALRCVGAARGCGLIGVLPHGACGLVETRRLTEYLAGESAGQCGPCIYGLPALAEAFTRLAHGKSGRW